MSFDGGAVGAGAPNSCQEGTVAVEQCVSYMLGSTKLMFNVLFANS